MNTIVFEDAAVGQLAPISLTRPAYAISCGSFRLIDWLTESSPTIVGLVRPHLQTLQLNDRPILAKHVSCEEFNTSENMLLVNARLAPTTTNIDSLRSLSSQQAKTSNQIAIARSGWAVAAAFVPSVAASSLSTDFETDRFFELQQLAATRNLKIANLDHDLELFNYPHEVIDQHMNHCGNAINFRLKHGSFREIQDGVFVATGNGEQETVIPAQTSFDTSCGPVIFENKIRIGPFCFFRGPVYVGTNSKVSEHAAIKDSVAIAHTCKIGGEIEGSQVEAWTNKQHYGFIGHSYLGSWINLGAGTCNSDLKNTYGQINMQYAGRKVPTGMQFVGCIMGDYSRTAINTSIYTGKTIGVGSTVYGMTAQNVPSFVNTVQSLRQTGILPAEILASIQKRMFGRREVAQRPCDIQLLHDVFRLTQDERDPTWTTDPIGF